MRLRRCRQLKVSYGFRGLTTRNQLRADVCRAGVGVDAGRRNGLERVGRRVAVHGILVRISDFGVDRRRVVGPSSTAMAAAATPYLAWMSATAGQAEEAAAQARAAASAYQSALTAMVPPAMIAANRTQLASLTATNILGQNTPAIAANEAQYGEMWAQDATAMYGYAGNSAAASTLTQFTAAPQTTSLAGSAAQGAAVAQATGTSTGTGVQSTLSQLLSSITTRYRASRRPVRRRRRRRDFRDF